MRSKGSVLILVLGLSFLLAAVAFSVLSLVMVRRRAFEIHSEEIQTRYELDGALEFCAQLITKAPYRNGRNTLLLKSVSKGAPLFSSANVDVTVRDVGDCYELILQKKDGRLRYRVWVKERSIPEGFVLFVLDDGVNITNSAYGGAIFARGNIGIVSDRETEFTHPLHTAGRFVFSSVAVVGSRFRRGYSEKLNILPSLPPDYIERLRERMKTDRRVTVGTAELLLGYETMLIRSSDGSVVSLLFQGEEVVVRVVGPEKKGEKALPIPDDGLIFVEGDVSLSGRLGRRLTLVSTGSIRIVDDLVYVDGSGREPFTDDGERVKEYSGDSSLALVALDDIIYQPKGETLKVCGLLVTLKGRARPADRCKAERLLIYGVRICKKRPFRLRRGFGFSSAMYLYDPRLPRAVPKFAPLLNIPAFCGLKVED